MKKEKAAFSYSDQGYNPKFKIHNSESKRRELWLYMAVSIVAVEGLIFVAALLFGFITGEVESGSVGQLSFPWLSWAAASIIVPSLMLLAVHMAVGLFRPSDKDREKEWEKELPEKLQKAYRILIRTPAMVLFLGIIGLGALLLTLDGAIHALEGLFGAFKPYLPHILIGIGVLAAIFGLAAIWLNYRTRKLYVDLEYRREVLHKTGLIIMDKRQLVLNPDDERLIPLEASAVGKALPEGGTLDVEAVKKEDIEDADYTESPDLDKEN